jgi:signal transduction histidine kinase
VSSNPETLTLEVIDCGSGVPAAFRDRLFRRFLQADSTSARKHNGSGLGLAITHELISRMGGTAGYFPDQLCGSVFNFNLPIHTAPSCYKAAS